MSRDRSFMERSSLQPILHLEDVVVLQPVASCPSCGRNNGCNEYNCVECQLCGKKGHTTLKYFKIFDRNYTGEEKSVGAAATSYDVDTSWYADSRATNQIIGDLEKFTT
jgi:hypothetical protein